jgi:hypothetical protein
MFIEAVFGFEWVAIIAVSSANVLRVVVWRKYVKAADVVLEFV